MRCWRCSTGRRPAGPDGPGPSCWGGRSTRRAGSASPAPARWRAPGRALLAGDPEAAADALDAALPPPVDHVLLQADLTAVAPGPLTPDLDRELTLAADVESRGGATVFRFTPDSVRRALDAGRTGDDLITWLERASSTPVPQPLRYLVQDTARRYGRIRIGTASCYVRADDESALAELLADRRSRGAAAAPPGTDRAGRAGAAGDRAVGAARDGPRAGRRVAGRRGRRPLAPGAPHPAALAAQAGDPAAAVAVLGGAAGGRAGAALRGRGGPGPRGVAGPRGRRDPARARRPRTRPARWPCSGTPPPSAVRSGSGTPTRAAGWRAGSSSRCRWTRAGSPPSTGVRGGADLLRPPRDRRRPAVTLRTLRTADR